MGLDGCTGFGVFTGGRGGHMLPLGPFHQTLQLASCAKTTLTHPLFTCTFVRVCVCMCVRGLYFLASFIQTQTLFAVMNDESSPSRRSDFQDEDAKCKIFTCCGEVNKLPSLACWDQSEVWAKDLKA